MSEELEDIQQLLLSQELPKEKVLALRKKVWDYQACNLSLLMNQDRLRRYNYLGGLLDVFPQFAKTVSSVISKNSKPGETLSDAGKQTSHRHRLTEKEEDEQLLGQKDEEEPNSMPFAFEQTPKYVKHSSLRDYQIRGLNWLISLFHNGLNGILADEMGLGKTLQTISLIGYLKHYEGIFGPHIIIVPKSILQNWYSEFRRWVPSVDAFIFHGNKPERADLVREKLNKCDFEVCITSYEICLLEKLHLKRFSWQYIIIDEAHRIKNEHSALSQIVREFRCRNRLLLTGTPLQNNIHELWTLLNFLLKDAFPDSRDFEKWFEPTDDNDSGTVVAQLHKILKPFLLRRIKMDVEKSLLPKKRLNIYVGMSEMQRKWYQNLLQKDIEVVNDTQGFNKSKVARLQNIVMQLRKCCNHPYLFEGAEAGPPYVDGDHLITNSGKMVVLDQLLTFLKEKNSRALIFSQMSRMLDILEDYCLYKGYEYCRIDGSTSHEDRILNIDTFNDGNSTKFIFLLTTRAGGLGINLATADTVVMYDCDWNPQVDLQAEDRAHRIGQKKQITVYRLITENAVEEKIIDRATQKLRLDQLIIQQGRSSHHGKASTKEELLQMVQHGAKDVFNSSNSTILNDSIEEIIHKSHEKSKKLDERYSNMSFEDLQRFTISGDSTNVYEWEGTNFKGKEKTSNNEFEWIGPTKRERKPIVQNYVELDPQRHSQLSNRTPKERPIKPLKSFTIHEFQFYPDNLKELLKKEAYAFKKLIGYKPKKEDFEIGEGEDTKAKIADEQALISSANPLTPDEIQDKENMIAQGFPNWNRKDFSAFCKASERFGRNDYESIAEYIGTKNVREVIEYAKKFWESHEKIEDYERIIKNIENGEIRLAKAKTIQNLIVSKIKKFQNPPYKLNIPYARNKSKNYSSEEDAYMLMMLAKHGYGTEDVYDKILADIRNCPTFRFNWFFKSRTPLDIHRRCNTLISMMTRKDSKKSHGDTDYKNKRKREKITTSPKITSTKSTNRSAPQESLRKTKNPKTSTSIEF